jgi:hypothetical protein
MKKNEVKIGAVYTAKVSDKVVEVRIDGENRHGGWDATNLATNKKVRIKSPQRLRSEVKTGSKKKAGAAKSADPAGLDVTPTVEIVTGEPVPEPAKREKKARKAAPDKPKRVSALDAAAEILKAKGQPMRAKDLIEAMATKGLWASPNGKTPEATLYAAMIREIRRAAETGTVSRFRKTDRGMFTFTG